jgi:hypothetical protein
MTFIGAYQDTEVVSQQDYNGTASGATVGLPPAFAAVFPGAAQFIGGGAGGGAAPVSTVPDVDTSLGLSGGDFLLSDTFSAQDTSTVFAEQTSFELRFNSQYNGPFNFMIAGSYFDFQSETDYFVRAPGLDYYWRRHQSGHRFDIVPEHAGVVCAGRDRRLRDRYEEPALGQSSASEHRAEYTHYFGNGASLSGRLDYYWQDDYSARIFGRTLDAVDSWDVWNAQATYTASSGQWWLRAFIQNIEDDDALTGVYSTDPSSGLFTNGFFVEPQLYGVSLGVQL